MWQPLPGMYQNPKLPEGKQVFSINLIVLYKHLRHSEFLISQSLGTSQNPSSQTPAKGQFCEQGFQRTAIRLAMTTLLHRCSGVQSLRSGLFTSLIVGPWHNNN